ncbi:MAG: nicotinate-nucleotide adenylyltransferase [Pyrinomonadaceae bacterium]
MKRIAFYGGSFDPLHNGHLRIAEKLTELFGLDEFVFIPAFHAPHKRRKKPTSAYQRFAMLCLATNDQPRIKVSKMELEAPERPYSIETLTRLKNELTETDIFFVMGADSWAEINTWREWEKVLTIVNIIVVTRPGFEIGFSHVTEEIRQRIVDLRGAGKEPEISDLISQKIQNPKSIFLSDAVKLDISATEIRRKIGNGEADWRGLVPDEVAKYIEKYDIY